MKDWDWAEDIIDIDSLSKTIMTFDAPIDLKAHREFLFFMLNKLHDTKVKYEPFGGSGLWFSKNMEIPLIEKARPIMYYKIKKKYGIKRPVFFSHEILEEEFLYTIEINENLEVSFRTNDYEIETHLKDKEKEGYRLIDALSFFV